MTHNSLLRTPLLDNGDGTYYLFVRQERDGPDRCDACGRRRAHGYGLLLGPMTHCTVTGAWSCTLDCARTNAAADYAA